MNIKRLPTNDPTSLAIGDIVVYEKYGACIVATYGSSVQQVGLINLSNGDWSGVSENLQILSRRLKKESDGDVPRFTKNEKWTLVEGE